MGKDKDKDKDRAKDAFDYAGTIGLDKLIQHLQDLSDRFAAGAALLDDGENRVELELPDEVQLRMRVRDRDDERSLRLEISWQRTRTRRSNGLAIREPAPRDRG